MASPEGSSNEKSGNPESCKSQKNGEEKDEPCFPVNQVIQSVPAPFKLSGFLEKHEGQLQKPDGDGKAVCISLFGDEHPDKEFSVSVCGAGEQEVTAVVEGSQGAQVETFLFQEKGECEVTTGDDKKHTLEEKGCYVLPAAADASVKLSRKAGSVTLLVRCFPRKNAEFYGY